MGNPRIAVAALIGIALTMSLMITACSTAPTVGPERRELIEQAGETRELFRIQDPSLRQRFADSYGYALFPTVSKAGIGVGGAYGRGIVYEDGFMVGYCDVTQGSLGLQLGGRAYSEVIFFEDARTLATFKAGQLELDPNQASTGVRKNAAAETEFADGAMVFTMDLDGLMVEAAIGGQRFGYQAK
jgi:lipid-binding SYLF domain-containing protein